MCVRPFVLLHFLFLIISTGTEQINPCSSLLCNSWSFIQQQQQHRVTVFCFPSLHVDLYVVHTKTLCLDSSHSHPTLRSFLEFNMLHWFGKNGFINNTNQTRISISFSVSAHYLFIKISFLLSSLSLLVALFKHFDSRMHYVSVKCASRVFCDQMQNVRKHTERKRKR